MKIKSMTASFGKLDGAKLELKDGLNIIEAPNESGKSTWCAFIRAMLFGINTSERDKQGFLSDKTRYRPWNGKNMEGVMELRHGGRDITIQRTSLASTPMKKFSAFYSDIMQPVEELSADTAGEILTGTTDKVFDRTAFIRQAGIAVSGDPGLESRIASLISTGEEHTSYTDADAKLRARQRKIRHNKTGILPKLESELTEREEQLSRMDKLFDELAAVRQERRRFDARSKQLAEDLDTYTVLEKTELIRRTVDAKKRAAAAGERVDELREALTKNGLLMNQDDVAQIAGLYSDYIDAETAAGKAKEQKTAAYDGMEKAQADKDAFPFKDAIEPDVLAKSRRAAELDDQLRTAEEKCSSAVTKFVLAAAVLLIGAGGYLAYAGSYIYSAIAAIIGVVCAALFAVPLVRKQKARRALELALGEFSMESSKAFAEKAGRYSEACRAIERMSFECKKADDAFEKTSAEADETKAALMDAVHSFFPEITEPGEIGPALSALSAPLKELPQAELEQAKALAEAGALISSSPVPIPEEPLEYIPTPPRSLEDTQKAYARAGERINELAAQEAMLTGELKALGDPVETRAAIDDLNDEIAEQLYRYDTLSIAIETLSDAQTELQTKFSPLVNAAASRIMGHLTSGKYEKLVFDKNFNALAETSGDVLSHDILTLSEGTTDQIYLSLRLAMAELLLSSGEPCPVILDDALDTFDDTRAKNALDYLYGMSKDRQIILFTCHSREAAMMAGMPDVNVVKLADNR